MIVAAEDNVDELSVFEDAWVNGTHADQALRKVLFSVKNRLGVVICGNSGVGKTAVARKVSASMEAHSTDTSSHRPSILVSLERQTKVRDVCLDLLEELGLEELGRYTERDLKKMLYRQIAVCRVALIIFDEFQHLLRRNNAAFNESVCDFIKILMMKTGIPVALFGTEDGAKLLKLNTQLKTRFTQPVVMKPLTIDRSGEPEYFGWFLTELLKLYPRNTENLASRDNALRLLMACGGNLRELKKILTAMMVEVPATPKRALTMKDAEQAYRNIHHDVVLRSSKGRRIDPFRSNIDSIQRYLKDDLGLK